ncbi:MAG: hypothetical protein IJE03_02860 [Ruminiclostridium sp.]|nr:hypothetical protein [Ruminiclostridium sp.]
MAHEGKFSQARPGNVTPQAEDTQALTPEAPVQEPVRTKKPVKKQAAPQSAPKKHGKKKKRKKKKANRTVTLIFYTCYFFLVAALLAGLWFLHGWLTDYLTTYEASQPTTRCEEVYQEHFADPDWSKLYTMAGIPDTAYEGSDAFAAWMSRKAAGRELTYVETSAGLSGGHKYLLKLDSETIGYFTLVDQAPEGAEIADWQLGQVSLNYAYPESVTIQKSGDVTVYANGVALTDDQVIQIGTTLAEEYLPAGVQGPRIYTQYLDGLMMEPEITATDADGNAVEVVYDVNQDLYIVRTEDNTITEELYDRVLATAKTYALRMIEKATKQELGKYFDTKSASYKTIVSIDPWMQEWFFESYEWGEEAITGYYRHSDKLFSVHVELPMLVTRTDDTVKEYKVDHSFFFELQGKSWKCINMTNVDIREQTASVRLTFRIGDSVIFTNMFAEDIATLELPTVTPPEGKVFDGWYRQEIDADGSIRYTQVFAPTETGEITLPAGTKLEPMILYALFVDAE